MYIIWISKGMSLLHMAHIMQAFVCQKLFTNLLILLFVNQTFNSFR